MFFFSVFTQRWVFVGAFQHSTHDLATGVYGSYDLVLAEVDCDTRRGAGGYLAGLFGMCGIAIIALCSHVHYVNSCLHYL